MWEVYTSKAFPPRMESIIKDGQLPVITLIDEEFLAASMPTDESKIKMIIWETMCKSVAKTYADNCTAPHEDLEKYYLNMWLQLAVSFQNQIQSMRDYAVKS